MIGSNHTTEMAESQHLHEQFPLAFDLWDMEEQPLLSTMGGGGQTLILRLSNESEEALWLDHPVEPAHFVLHFRKGILLQPRQIRLEAHGEGWSLEVKESAREDQLLLHGPAGLELSPGRPWTLLLHRVRSDGARGTRNSRVMLAYSHLRRESGLVAGMRETVISVVHQYPPEARGERGARRRPLPVRLGFAGANTVTVDSHLELGGTGHNNRLRLQISNLASETIVFRRDPANEDRSSRLILSFEAQDEGEQRAWALGTVDQVEQIEPALGLERRQDEEEPVLPAWEPVRFADAEQVVWVFTPQQPEIPLEPGRALLLEVANIRTSLPEGPANLHLTLENVPDPQGGFYADQQQTLTVQKSAQAVPAGALLLYGGKQAPPGWLLCDGRPLKAREFPALFEVIGYDHGGDGEHFQLPALAEPGPAHFSYIIKY